MPQQVRYLIFDWCISLSSYSAVVRPLVKDKEMNVSRTQILTFSLIEIHRINLDSYSLFSSPIFQDLKDYEKNRIPVNLPALLRRHRPDSPCLYVARTRRQPSRRAPTNSFVFPWRNVPSFLHRTFGFSSRSPQPKTPWNILSSREILVKHRFVSFDDESA